MPYWQHEKMAGDLCWSVIMLITPSVVSFAQLQATAWPRGSGTCEMSS
jgi:hypothetical protein